MSAGGTNLYKWVATCEKCLTLKLTQIKPILKDVVTSFKRTVLILFWCNKGNRSCFIPLVFAMLSSFSSVTEVHQMDSAQIYQRHRGAFFHQIKTWKQRLSEGRGEGVNVKQFSTREDLIEGQRSSLRIQEHAHYIWEWEGRRREERFSVFVTDRVPSFIDTQTPRLIIVSKPILGSASSLSESSVTHCSINSKLCTPLQLPVTTPRQASGAQDLRLLREPLCMIWVLLLLSHSSHSPFVFRQKEIHLSCVWIQGELTVIWRHKHRNDITSCSSDTEQRNTIQL